MTRPKVKPDANGRRYSGQMRRPLKDREKSSRGTIFNGMTHEQRKGSRPGEVGGYDEAKERASESE